jgi:cyclic pyranopterin phosphate synthase
LSYEEITRFVSLLQDRCRLTGVRITGGEPLIRPEIVRLVAMLAEAGAPDLALTTSGQQLAALADVLKCAGLNRVNISLDSLDPRAFAAITRGGVLDKTLAGITAARRARLDPVKLNAVVLRGLNDREAPALVRFATSQGCQVRFLELMPIGVAADSFEDLFVPAAEVRSTLAGEFELSPLPVHPEDTSRNFMAVDGLGRRAVVGFISPSSEPFCGACARLRLTATGVLIGCLARDEGVPLAPLLRAGSAPDVEALDGAIQRALSMKRRDGAFAQPRAMVGIGG